jgi:Flp pilus assembly protein TadD
MRLPRSAGIAGILALALMVSACGSNRFERGVTGGAIGTAAGAGVMAIAGGPVLAGAAAGAVGGAAIGALTNECQIDLGPQRPNGC